MLEQLSSEIAELVASLRPQLSALAAPALFFFLLSVGLNRGNLKRVLRKAQPRSLKVNLLAYLVDILLLAGPLAFIVTGLSSFVARHDLSLLDSADFESVPAVAVALLALLAGDAIGYFRHRIEHSRLLWPMHVLHHSDDDMTWFTLFRFHPVNRMTTVVIDVGFLLAIGIPGWAIVLNGVVRHYYGMLIHADVPWTYGWLGRVFVSPAMHRWHHVMKGRGINSNYATLFSVFDQVFGTYYVPGPCDQPLGVKGVRPEAFWPQIVYPVTVAMNAIRSRKGLAVEER